MFKEILTFSKNKKRYKLYFLFKFLEQENQDEVSFSLEEYL